LQTNPEIVSLFDKMDKNLKIIFSNFREYADYKIDAKASQDMLTQKGFN
jgi:hypothetical protein